MSDSRIGQGDLETRLAQWAAGLSLSDIPLPVQAMARTCMADGLGVMLAGSATAVFAQCAALPRGRGPCDVADGSDGADARSAALLNGTAGHALDFDDTCYAGIVHGTAVVLPAVLAVAQEVDAGGARLLEAFVAGVEAEYALGLALTDSLYGRGFWATATLGVVGAAVGAAKLLGLDAARMAHAIRLAANMPIGLRVTHGANAKPFLCGMAARLGVEAAQAAEVGMAGQPGTFERSRGYAAALNDGTLEVGVLDAMGRRYALLDPGVAFKLWPLCSAAQAAIEAVIALRAQHVWELEQVESVQCRGTALVVTSLPYFEPVTVAEAQFSMPFAVASTLLHGGVGLDRLNETTLADPVLRQLMSRVELVEDEALAPVGGACPEAVSVEIELSDGRRVSHTVLAATGMPQRPASAAALLEKFMACATRVTTEADARGIWDRLQSLECVPGVRRLLDRTTSLKGV